MVRDIRIGAVQGTNVLRNIVSIVGGREINIGRISGSHVGYTHLDIEPEDYTGPVSGCTIESVRGGFVQIAGSSAKAYVDRVRIGRLDLAGPVPRSVPVYKPGLRRADALTIRNIRSLEIGTLIARGFDGNAIRQVWNPGALTDQNIHIASAELIDCARAARAGRAYILGDKRATRLRIDRLKIDLPRPGIDIIRDCKEARVRDVVGRVPRGSRLVAETEQVPEGLLYLVGAGALLYGASRLVRD